MLKANITGQNIGVYGLWQNQSDAFISATLDYGVFSHIDSKNQHYESTVTTAIFDAHCPIKIPFGIAGLSVTPVIGWVGQHYDDDQPSGSIHGNTYRGTLGLRATHQFKSLNTFVELDYRIAKTPTVKAEEVQWACKNRVEKWLAITSGFTLNLTDQLRIGSTLNYQYTPKFDYGLGASIFYRINAALNIDAGINLEKNESNSDLSGILGLRCCCW